MNVITILVILKELRTIIGIIFWTVDNNNSTNRVNDLESLKNHPWNGAAPNLIIILATPTVSNIKFVFIIDTRIVEINKIDAILWTKKYFIELSIGEYSLEVINGKNLNIFNSKLSHIITLELLLIATNSLIKRINLNPSRGEKIIILIRNGIFLLTINSSVLLKAFINWKSGWNSVKL